MKNIVKLPERSILDELAEQKSRIIEEGEAYIRYIYMNLARRPKRTYSFHDLISNFQRLRLVKGKEEIQIAGLTNDGKNVIVIKTRNLSLYPFFRRVVHLFLSFKISESKVSLKY